MSNTSKTKIFLFVLSIALTFSSFLYLQPLRVQARGIDLSVPSTIDQISRSSSLQLASTGLITGDLSFPSERIPPLTIFAVRIDNGLSTYYSIETAEHQSSYTIEVDPGVYLVFAYNAYLAGGYTRYVTCGMGVNCSDHIPHQVVVVAGDTIENIDLLDWYAPVGTFPARPDGPTQATNKPVCTTYHTIRWGETLYKIGLQYNLTWKPIAQANNIINSNRIYAGQVLCIPNTAKSSTGTLPSSSTTPTFLITGVTRNKQVSIETRNFPPFQDFKVTMGKIYTKGIDGIEVDETYSSSGGSFNATYTIPRQLRGLDRIAIRLESPSGYYSYNWFYNNTIN